MCQPVSIVEEKNWAATGSVRIHDHPISGHCEGEHQPKHLQHGQAEG